MNVRDAMREREKARWFWRSLSTAERWEIGDELVLGGLDLLRWFDGKRPSSVFINELDRERINWETTL